MLDTIVVGEEKEVVMVMLLAWIAKIRAQMRAAGTD